MPPLKEQPESARVLEKALTRFKGQLTVADAAAKAGLPLRDAEEGLRHLAAEYSGHLAATEKGEIIYSFPRGLEKPPETRLSRRIVRGLSRVVVGAARFMVRAWVSVVLVGYAALFLVLAIAWALRSDDSDGPGPAIAVVFRVLAEALFWTFHPFSPVYLGREPAWMHHGHPRGRRLEPKVPFYERVNRFVFGPPKPVTDPREQERLILAEIRRQKGRIAVGDVMRVTGQERDDAERMLLRLMLDYDGDLEVAESGAIIYKFPALRTTAEGRGALTAERAPAAMPVWAKRMTMPPLTGNTAGSNTLFVAINTFNLIASSYALANDLTLERLTALFVQMQERYPTPLPPADGLPLVLGAIPFAFSLAVFALPLLRALGRPAQAKKVSKENGWRGLLRLALAGRNGKVEYSAAELSKAWVAAGGNQPSENELRDAVRALGGDIDVDTEKGQVVYRFDLLEKEAQATALERRAASAEEVSAGRVVFSSEEEGHGILEDERRPVFTPEERRALGGEAGEAGAGDGDAAGDGARRGQRALPEKREKIEDDVQELLERLGVDTRRRRR